MEVKILAAVKKLLGDFKDLSARVGRLEKVKPAVVNGRDGKDGRDGVNPSVEEVVSAVIKQLPEPEKIDTKAIVDEVVAKIPKPRDGRDAQQVNVSDVAAIVLAKIPKPRDGKDGRNGPDLETVVKRVKAQVRNGDTGPQGPRGPQGPAGKNGVSVTDVQLNGNDLFVFLDGAKKKAGSIRVPTLTAPFNPGNAGGGGSARTAPPKDNAVYVSTAADFPDQDSGTITLRSTCIYILTANVTTSKRFIVEDGALITGRNLDSYSLTYTGAGDMFTGVDVNFSVRDLTLDCPSAQVFNFSETVGGQKRFICDTVLISGSTKVGTFEDLNLVEFLNSQTNGDDGITLLGTAGITFSIGRLAMLTDSATFIGVDFGTSSFTVLEIDNLIVVGVPGGVGISGLVNSGNLPVGRRGMVTGSEFIGVTPLQNIQINDIRWEFTGNSPIGNSRNAADVFLTGGAETITINTSGVFEEIGIPSSGGVSWDSEIQDRFTVGTDGVITYIGEVDINVQITGTATVEKVGGGQDELEVRLAKNWLPGESGLEKSRAITQNSQPTSVPLTALIPLTNGDNIRVIFANNDATTNVIAQVTSVDVLGA